MDGGSYSQGGGYTNGGYGAAANGQQVYQANGDDGMYGHSQGGYRRGSPGMEARMSPPTQYVAGSFPPPQLFHQRSGHGYQQQQAHEGGMKGFTNSKMYKKVSGAVNQMPWRYLSFCLLFLSAYFFMQWKACTSGLHASSSSATAVPMATKTGSFAELQKSVSTTPGSMEDPGAAQDTGLSAGAESDAESTTNGLREELRRMAIEPTSWDAKALLRHPLAQRIIVSEKARIMYCPIPKAANSNWKLLIRKYEGFEDYADLAKAHDKKNNGLKYLSDFSADEVTKLLSDPNMIKFTFARDPLSRTLSCYLNKIENKEKNGDEYKTYMAQLFGWEFVNQHDIVNEPKPSFDQFVSQISTQKYDEMNEHWAPQSYLCGIGLFPYDFVGKLEEVDVYAPKIIDWMADGKESHFPTQDEIKFSSLGTSNLLDQYYNGGLKDKVRQTFSDDYRVLKYNS